MIKVVIVDDEKQILKSISRKISVIQGFKVIGSFSNPLVAYNQILALEPDIVITDIKMPVLSGIELANKVIIKKNSIQFVFLTAYREYAVEAFQLNALHYIMKPVLKKDLETVLKRFVSLEQLSQSSDYKKNRIFVLGQFTVINSHNQRVSWQTLKIEELFALLLMHRDKGLDRWRLIYELWDINEIKDPLQNLYSSIYRLRKTFEKYELPYSVNIQNGNYKVNIVETEFDYEIYSRLSETYRDLEITFDNLEIYEKISNLYNGAVFGFKDYQWSLYEREKLDKNNAYFIKKLKKFYKKENLINKISLIDIKSRLEEDLFL